MTTINPFTESMGKPTIHSAITPRQHRSLQIDEKCSLCEKEIPENRKCIRHSGTNNVICISCLVLIKFLK